MGMFVSLTVNGLAIGMVYALMAMGLILLIRAVGMMNFAQGDLLMIGAYITWALAFQLNLPAPLMLLCAFVIFALFGLLFMFAVYWPVRNSKWPAALMICTLGASIVIKEGVRLIWGSSPRSLPPIIPGVLRIGSVVVEYQYLVTILVGAVVMTGVFFLFEKLYAGRMMQAASQDKYAAELLGIPTIITTAATFVIVMLIAGTGGYLVAPIFLVTTSLGLLQLRAFAGVVIGGFGSLKGAIIGSILIGLIESYSTYITTTYKDVIVFAVLILVLVVRPQGLFGASIDEKA